MHKKLIKKLEQLLGKERVLQEEALLHAYAFDGSPEKPRLPGVVVIPENQDQVRQVVSFCAQEGLALIVRGAGTNLSGGTIPVRENTVVLLTVKLNRILEINPQDLYARVEPGVITLDFARAVSKEGLFYPPDPGSQAVSTLGGNVVENAGGLRGLKYGVTKDYVLALKFIDGLGEEIKAGARTVKWVSGYNLPGLLTGSEGQLGVITEITFKLIPPPKSSQAILVLFNSLQRAAESVSLIIAQKIIPCTLEFLDKFTLKAVEEFRQIGLPTSAQAILLIEVDGHPEQVKEESELILKICQKQQGEVFVARDEEEKNKLWQARRDALPALARLKPTTILEDATVPRSKITEMVLSIEKIAQKYGLDIGTFGHAGDGNLHPTILTDKRDKREAQKVEKAIEEIFNKALELEGTLSGEHGIGLSKKRFLVQETGLATLNYFRRIKKAADPKNILNPGKVVE